MELGALCRALNATKRFDEAVEVGSVVSAGREFSFLVGSRVVRSGDRSWNLPAPFLVNDGAVWVVPEFLNDVLVPENQGELTATLDRNGQLELSAGFDVQLERTPVPDDVLPLEPGPRRVRRIILDPTHGGDDAGAALPDDQQEKWLTLSLARTLAEQLRAAGFEAVLTRNEDRNLGPDSRAAFANQSGGDLYLALGVGEWGQRSKGEPDDTSWVVVHGTVGTAVSPVNVAGFNLRRWGFVHERHLRASATPRSTVVQRPSR